MTLAGSLLLVLGCGSNAQSLNDGSKSSGGQPNYAPALRSGIESAMRANVIPGAIVLIKSRDKGDWRATFGTGEIGKNVPLSMTDYVRIGSNTKTMTSTVSSVRKYGRHSGRSSCGPRHDSK